MGHDLFYIHAWIGIANQVWIFKCYSVNNKLQSPYAMGTALTTVGLQQHQHFWTKKELFAEYINWAAQTKSIAGT